MAKIIRKFAIYTAVLVKYGSKLDQLLTGAPSECSHEESNMSMNRLTLASLLLVCSLMVVGVCAAEGFSPSNVVVSPLRGADNVHRGSYVTLGLRKYINSFTSYQFPNYPPSKGPQDPLSRLEHPWDQVWGLVRLGSDLKTVAVNLEFAASLSSHTALKVQDSDWSDKNHPSQKTTFSQSEDRPSGWTLDVSATAPLPQVPILSGVIGYRLQQFRFDAYDDLQGSIWDETTRKYRTQTNWVQGHGPAGELTQYYNHYYAGGVAQGLLPMGALFERLGSASLLLKLQCDYGCVTGKNADFHFLRADKGTFDETTGWSWHVNLTTGLYIGDRLSVNVEGDFLRIRTSGTHHENNATWDGAKVWSDQQFLSIGGKYAF